MLKNFFTTAVRSLIRNRVHSVINIAGLALGIACCLVIFLVVRYEWSYDAFHSKADRIYRVNTKFLDDGTFNSSAPKPIAATLKQDFPEVQEATTTNFVDEGLVKVGTELYKETGITYVAPTFFRMFDAQWLAGNPATALAEPHTVVLTQSIALKYFGGAPDRIAQTTLGKTIKLNGVDLLKVTGVLADFPANTDLPFKILISYISLESQPNNDLTSWTNVSSSFAHFVLLPPGADPQQLEKKLPAFEKKYLGVDEARLRTHVLQPLREMHSDNRFGNYSGRTMDKESSNGLILIGLFILLTACINFINLSTAQSAKRSKEVGVRKVLGANRSQLVRQFLIETLLLSIGAMLLAALLTYLLLLPLKQLLTLHLDFNPFNDGELFAFLIMITLSVSLLAGFYPALILSGYQPVVALKNKFMAGGPRALSLRRSLIVLQFAIAQILIISTIIVSGQLDYFRSKPLGFNKDAVLTIPFPQNTKPQNTQALRTQLEQLPGVKSVSFARFTPSDESNWYVGFNYPGSGLKDDITSQNIPIDHRYVTTFGLTLVAGKDLTSNNDSADVLVNEALVRKMNIKNSTNALYRKIIMNDKNYRIVGVVKDFHTQSLHAGINPVILLKAKTVYLAGIKLNAAKLNRTIAQIEQIWEKTYPESLFEFKFLDETIANFYREEVKMFKLFRLFAGVAIFISCLGLYGLVSFMAVQRTKEIGIRKVLGASVANIVGLFTKEFFGLILVAFAIAAPLGWYAMQAWLQNFEFRNPMGPGSFLIAILFSLLIAGITVIYRSVRAALTNPVQNLRTE